MSSNRKLCTGRWDLMAEMKNTEKQNIGIQKEEEKEKLESVKKADAAVKSNA